VWTISGTLSRTSAAKTKQKHHVHVFAGHCYEPQDTYRVFFEGALVGACTRDDDDFDYGHENPFETYPQIYGHLDLPWVPTPSHRIAGFYTLADDPYEDGGGPRAFEISGDLRENDLILKFAYNSLFNPGDDDGYHGDMDVCLLSKGQLPALMSGVIGTRLAFRGDCSFDWPVDMSGSCDLALKVVARPTLEKLHGAWSGEGWRDHDGDDYLGFGPEGNKIRAGPHPSLIPAPVIDGLDPWLELQIEPCN